MDSFKLAKEMDAALENVEKLYNDVSNFEK